MPEQSNWNQVLTCHIFPKDEGLFLTSRAHKVAAGVFGDKLVLTIGVNSNEHSYLLEKARRFLAEKSGVSLPNQAEWTAGAFVDCPSKDEEINIWGSSDELDGELTEEIKAIAVGEFSHFGWIDE